MDALLEPLEYGLLQRAFAEAVLMGAACGLLGVLVLLRGLAYTGESLSHALLPGAAIALAIGVPAAGGAVVGAVAAALVVAIVARRPDVGEDAAVAVVLPAAFAAGVVVISIWGTGRDLDSLLFGSILGVERSDLVLGGSAVVLAVGLVVVAGRRLVLTAFDRPFARATSARPDLCDALLLVALALALAVALRGVGSLLVLALLIAPAAAARLVVDRVATMLWLAPALGVVSGVVGLELSYHADLAASSSVAVVALALFAAAVVVRPLRRLVAPATA